ncbi:CDGSH iron-sulfur domain-containing protein [Roseisalinus antarcticus]|uniref:Iron-binding zinc finger CDGSH type n=1 Tax=Roseisalinus antarcticus TaxID=254357 RepID=A0A1Y5SXF8_9RHOB|nr:CDGSH iron-sulfur domain-containing protein [Roseisalinus antarcticus]SLN50868.1 Iron-binding zinc finger CDGSH type [Roseisalinus antarcticus]
MVRRYTGADIEIAFDMGRCIHARNCFLKLPQVFDPERRPWVSPDAAPAEEIAAMIRTCPSGALSYARKDGVEEETPPARAIVRVRENGPLAFNGGLQVDGEKMPRATLCRCGKSKRKPYCDNSHVEEGFAATGEPAPEVTDPPTQAAGDSVSIRPLENGPLGVVGPCEVVTGTGGRIARGERLFFCRCGQSANKPFCDGSHSRAGFAAPGPAES